MSFKYELLKKLVVAAGLKKRWLSVTTEELLEDRRKQNAKNHIPALKDDAFEFSRIDVIGFPKASTAACIFVLLPPRLTPIH